MGDFAAYLDRLRELVPARTLTLYLLGTGLTSSLASDPQKVADDYGWMLLVIALVCLVLTFLGRLLEKQGIAAAAISAGAFLLLSLTQRFTGPLAALKVDKPAFNLFFTFLAAVYVVVISMVWKPKPQ
jgi:hypothetical protein